MWDSLYTTLSLKNFPYRILKPYRGCAYACFQYVCTWIKHACTYLEFSYSYQNILQVKDSQDWALHQPWAFKWCCHWRTGAWVVKGIVRTYEIHLLGTYVTILCNWLILWQNTFYLYLDRFMMCLNTSRNHVSRSSVEPFNYVQENKLKVQSY